MTPAWPVAEVETERRRLAVLQRLSATPGYEASALLLREYCRNVGVPTTTDQMTACIAWLAEQGLVTTRDIEGDPIPRITVQGRETAEGHRSQPGVWRPDP